jgi:hypothetical protein
MLEVMRTTISFPDPLFEAADELASGPGDLSQRGRLVVQTVLPRAGDFQILTDLAGEKLVDLPVPRDRGALPSDSVDEDGVAASLAKQLAAMAFEMPDEVDPLHAVSLKGSRITSAP